MKFQEIGERPEDVEVICTSDKTRIYERVSYAEGKRVIVERTYQDENDIVDWRGTA